jgi:hypothetical protein
MGDDSHCVAATTEFLIHGYIGHIYQHGLYMARKGFS